ncbi:MAG: hypothetical protein KDA61_10905 [Planctomycetales bacterium]|nr:hypothetical protein [Planctomycetales bacterium]
MTPAYAAASSAPAANPFDAASYETVPFDGAQVASLDAMAPPDVAPVRMASLAVTTVPRADQVPVAAVNNLPPGARDGIFQKALFSAMWLPALSEEPDALGITELDARVVYGFPFFRRDTPLLITPQLNVQFLDNASALDLPSSLLGTGLEFRHMRKFGDGPWAMDVAATVGYYNDFHTDSSEAVRVSGRGLAVYETSPSTQWILGVAYLNRAGASVLPVVGVIHEPTSDTRWELLFPRPRLAWRTAGSVPSDESWLYLGAEFGGGVWAITRPSATSEELLQYSDYRLMGGYERKIRGGLTRRFEFGYVFNREIEFTNDPRLDLDDSFFGRVGLTY